MVRGGPVYMDSGVGSSRGADGEGLGRYFAVSEEVEVVLEDFGGVDWDFSLVDLVGGRRVA